MQIPLELVTLTVVALTLICLGIGLWALITAIFEALIMDTAPHYITLEDRLQGTWANAGYTLACAHHNARAWVLCKAYASGRLVKLLLPWAIKTPVVSRRASY